MKFQEVEFEDGLTGTKLKHIIIENEDGSIVSIPAIEGNPEYDAWLEAQTPTEGTK